jgi:hypothetical protein
MINIQDVEKVSIFKTEEAKEKFGEDLGLLENYFLSFAAIGFGISIAINIIRYMLSYVADDERTRELTKGSIAISISSCLIVFGMVTLLTFIEEQLPRMFSKSGGYGEFINYINTEINDAHRQVSTIVNREIGKLRQAFSIGQESFSIFGIQVAVSGCKFNIAGPTECLAGKQKDIAERTALINIAFDTEVLLVVGHTLFDFAIKRLAPFLLAAGFAYYTFDPTRSAGAAMIATALGIYYVYPVAYTAFFAMPSPPELTGGADERLMVDIASEKYCGLTTVPSVHIERSDVSISMTVQSTMRGGDNPQLSLQTGNLIGFLNSIYTSFLLKHGAALAVTLVFINNAYAVLSIGLTAAPLIRGFGRFL